MVKPQSPCRVFALASTKGGTGKTTLAACLSVEAAKTGRAVLIDADPQQSLARWHELRRKHDDSGNPGLFRTGSEPLAEKVALLKRAGADWVFIDLPPGDLDLIAEGIAAADIVIIPIRASPLDVEAIGPVKELSGGKVHVVVLNAFEPTWKISNTVEPYAKAAGIELLGSRVTNRQAYTGAMVGGATGPEYHDAKQARVCVGEIADLWAEVHMLATSGRKYRP